MTVMSFTGVDTSGTNGSGAIGAIGGNSGSTAAPAASLVTTRANSRVFGVGNDYDRAIARTIGPGQTMINQYLATVGDTYWVQRQTNPTPLSGTSVSINDTAPANDRYNLSIVEVLASSNPTPDLTITKSHSGNFVQGQTGANYTITATNGGSVLTTGTVSVTDTLPTGLTATAISGTGWTCTLATLTCTRSDALAAAASYPAITLTVNVASNAPASVTNTATVSGGGETNTSNDAANDITTINAARPDHHQEPFRQLRPRPDWGDIHDYSKEQRRFGLIRHGKRDRHIADRLDRDGDQRDRLDLHVGNADLHA